MTEAIDCSCSTSRNLLFDKSTECVGLKMSDEIVRYEIRGGIAALTMDDGKANALSFEMVKQIGGALDRAESDGAKAVLLAGREGRFCAGFDLRVMMQGPVAARSLVAAGGELLLRLYEFPRPVVIACTGHALAGGALVVATGDTRIGAEGNFKIGLNEVKSSMPVPIFAQELARDRLDPREFVASVLQSRIYDPEGAKRAGWLDRVVAAPDLAAAAFQEAEDLAKLSAGAYGLTKSSLRRQTIRYIRETLKANLAELLPG